MKVTTKGRYAVRLMVDLAAHHENEENISLRDVARRQGVSMKYLEQIVRQLVKSGFVRSERGPQGGYKLKRPPHEYSIGDVLHAMQVSFAPVACMDYEPNPCPRSETCMALDFWRGLHERQLEYLHSVTLKHMAEREMFNLEHYEGWAYEHCRDVFEE